MIKTQRVYGGIWCCKYLRIRLLPSRSPPISQRPRFKQNKRENFGWILFWLKIRFMLQVRVTSNPLAGEGEPENELGTCFDNPNHIELPSANQRSSGGSSAIDTTTYSKRDRMRNSFAAKSAIKPSAMIAPTNATTTATTTASMVAPSMATTRNE